MSTPVAPEFIEGLYAGIPDFRRAYDEDGLAPAEFDGFGATVRTLRAFIAATHELMGIIRETYMLPNLDV